MLKITESSKLILAQILKCAIQNGDLRVFINYPDLMQHCNIDDKKFFGICMKYLYESPYLRFIRKDDDDTRFVELTAQGIDFVEAE